MTVKKIYITFILCCLMSTAQFLKYWEIQRENGIKEMCCFCRNQDLRTGQHVIPECNEKFGKMTFLEYVGPPICSCLSSRKYPKCPDNQDVCGRNIQCPNNRVYESCHITELLTEKTMTCNDSLQWEHGIVCQENLEQCGQILEQINCAIQACIPSNKIQNGIAQCGIFGNKIVCNCICNDGFDASQTTNLSCVEAKGTVCLLRTKDRANLNLLLILLPIGIGIIIMIIIICIIYKKWRPSQSHANDLIVESPAVPMTERGSHYTSGKLGSYHTPAANGHIANGYIANGHIANGHIERGSHYTSGKQEIPNTPEERGIHDIPEEQSNHNTLDEGGSNHTPDEQGNYNTLDAAESLTYDEGLTSMGFPSYAESLQSLPPQIREDCVETFPKTFTAAESQQPLLRQIREDCLPFSIQEIGEPNP